MKVRERYPFGYDAITRVPRDVRGVYAFWYKERGRCIYVGMTERQTIRTRLFQHWSGSHNETLRLWLSEFGDHIEFCWLQVPVSRVRGMERRLIDLWQPEADESRRRS